ncbi:unnamed protein product [Prunus armeniaca]
MMMIVLIPEDPGRSIDVYLRQLVDELKDLWTNGVRTYDKSTRKMFTLRTAVMWTVNDFPAYSMVSGWSTKGYIACPVCKEDVTSDWHARKVCYLGHQRWLPWDHEWQEKDKEFDKNTECRLRPREWFSDEILEQLNRLDFAPFEKTVSRTRTSTHMNWLKLKLRHNLDVMHVEKNVFDTLVGTILDIEGKTKDTIKARLNLERMGIRRGLWMNMDSDKAKRDLAFFAMKPNDKKEFLKFVSFVKFPNGFLHKYDARDGSLARRGIACWLLGELKKSVHNTAKPEGLIIEAWVQYESLTFCGMYLKDVETAFNRPQRNNDGGMRNEKLSVFAQNARPFGDLGRGESFSRNDMEVAHWFVLNNCDEIMAYLDEHEEMMKREHPSHLYANKHRELFPQWFLDSVKKLKSSNSPTYSDELYNLVVMLTASNFWGLHKMTSCVRKTAVSMSQCRWFDTNPNRPRSVKIDHGLLSLNINRTWYDDNPYILANMATQIVYLDDPKAGSGWKVVQKMDHWNVYAILELDPTDNDVDNVVDQLGPSNDDDVVIVEEEEEDWETKSDDSDDNESYYSSNDE